MQINTETLNIFIIQESGFLWKDSSFIGIVINEIFNMCFISIQYISSAGICERQCIYRGLVIG